MFQCSAILHHFPFNRDDMKTRKIAVYQPQVNGNGPLLADGGNAGQAFLLGREPCSMWVSHGSVPKEFACNAGDPGSILGSGRSPGEGNGNPLQYSCLENPHG